MKLKQYRDFFQLALTLAVASHASATVDFAAQVAPILEQKCVRCHNPNNLKGDLSLTTREDILVAGDDYLIPGNSEDSMLHWITVPYEEGEPPEMPEDGEPLTEDEAALLARWIDEGAQWPDGLVLKEASKADQSWWAYQPLLYPEFDSIDAFVESKLSENGLAMNPEADRRTLIRRATYDLTGLPPTPEEVEAFVASTDPKAYEKLIDRLLDSPHYGERWGRHWLDVVRFGESNGYERNFIINDLWPFRDYVIRSLNEDKPFDQFIREHLAGDVFGKGKPDVEIGSAFLVSGPYDDVGNQDPAQAAQIRANTLDEIINATGEAFLGMTLACARCHDHKFDPISQQDYYELYATFAGIRHGSVPWATPEEKRHRASVLKPLEEREMQLSEELEGLESHVLERSRANLDTFASHWTRPPADRKGTEERFAPINAKFVRFVCEAQDLNPTTGRGFRMDEFEIWSSGSEAMNVALKKNGGKASGKAREIQDFPDAYGPQHLIDGAFGKRFFAASNDFVIELAKPTEIDRVYFSSARIEDAPEHAVFVFVADYRIEVSQDGESWTEVAHGRDRKPVPKKFDNPNKPRQIEFVSHLDHRLLVQGMTEDEQVRRAAIKTELAEVKRSIASIPELPKAWIGRRVAEDAAGPFHIFLGGSPQKKGPEVAPASISTLDQVVPAYRLPAETDEARRRLALAEWITHPDNPLTPRVLANRIWQYHFGNGIVDTPNDFGYMGGQPTHPELLDFLAAELKGNGWRIKDLHRMIMGSKAYRQSSQWREDGAKADADSRLLWRFPKRRLSAEEIRDTILSVTGKLDTNMEGPGFRLYHFMRDNVCTYVPLDEHGPETYRRAVYHQNARASVVDLMTDFDQADCTLSVPRRAQTTTPLQALTLMNHSFTIDMAEALAAKIQASSRSNSEGAVKRAYELAYQREPDREELARGIQVVDEIGLRGFCRAILNSSELIFLD